MIVRPEAGNSTETTPLPLRQELIGRLSVDLNVIPPVDEVCSAARTGLNVEASLATTETSLAASDAAIADAQVNVFLALRGGLGLKPCTGVRDL